MADAVDRANEYVQAMVDTRLARLHRYAGDGPAECESCDQPIPEARRQALPGVTLCIHCQERKEAHQR